MTVNKIIALGKLIKTSSHEARDYGREITEIWDCGPIGFYSVHYNDAYPEGRKSKNAFAYKVKPVHKIEYERL